MSGFSKKDRDTRVTLFLDELALVPFSRAQCQCGAFHSQCHIFISGFYRSGFAWLTVQNNLYMSHTGHRYISSALAALLLRQLSSDCPPLVNKAVHETTVWGFLCLLTFFSAKRRKSVLISILEILAIFLRCLHPFYIRYMHVRKWGKD